MGKSEESDCCPELVYRLGMFQVHARRTHELVFQVEERQESDVKEEVVGRGSTNPLNEASCKITCQTNTSIILSDADSVVRVSEYEISHAYTPSDYAYSFMSIGDTLKTILSTKDEFRLRGDAGEQDACPIMVECPDDTVRAILATRKVLGLSCEDAQGQSFTLEASESDLVRSHSGEDRPGATESNDGQSLPGLGHVHSTYVLREDERPEYTALKAT